MIPRVSASCSYYISEAGETEKRLGFVSEDQISFTTDHNNYYALAEQTETEETGDSGKPSGESDENGQQSGSNASGGTSGTDSPKTGDDTASGFWNTAEEKQEQPLNNQLLGRGCFLLSADSITDLDASNKPAPQTVSRKDLVPLFLQKRSCVFRMDKDK